MKRLIWLLAVLFVTGCGGEVTPTAVPPTSSPTIEMAAAEHESTETAVPPQPTTTLRATDIPPTPPQPTTIPPTATVPATETAAPPAADVPTLVWLPYAAGNFGQPVLMLEEGEIAPQPMPVEVEIFFDYDAGWLAYGSYFWEPTADQQSVTDLHLYDFATGEDAVWAEQVGRAVITPLEMLDGPPSVATAIHNGLGFDLVLIRGPENRTALVEDIDPYFSWSPDGQQIAYLRGNELFVTDVASDSGNPPIASGVYADGGWIGDAPLWLGDSGYLLYADAPFTIVAVDGSETIMPTAVDGTPLAAERPYAMLYSPTANQLITQSEGMFGPSVAIHQFSDAFETAARIQQFDDAQLAGWHEEGESVILIISGEPTILPLKPQE